MDCISLGRMGMIKPDTLDKAQAENRAPWKDVVHEFKDIVWYNDGYPVTEGHSLVVPKEATQNNIIKCFVCNLINENDM